MTGQVSERVVEIYTGGVCAEDGGPGGWGAVLRYGSRVEEMRGGEAPQTTNSRMELLAAVKALERLTRPAPVRLHANSSYLRDGITRWLRGGRPNGSQTAERGPVENVDLWRRLDTADRRHRVEWVWADGQPGDRDYGRANELAN